MVHFLFKIRHFLFAMILFLISENIAGNEKKKKIAILPVPTVGYSPETKTYLGSVVLFTFKNRTDSLTRTSNAKIEMNYTWNKQIISELDWNWFSPGEKWFSKGLIHYSKYPDVYYGIGFDSPGSLKTGYQSNRTIAAIDLLRNIKNDFYLGVGSIVKSYQNIEYLTSVHYFSELTDEISFGINFSALIDSRNNLLNPSKGRYFQVSSSLNFNSGIYFITKLDYRKYLSFGEAAKHILSGRFYHSTVTGNPPFFDYPALGGDDYTRGYYQGRYIDRHLSFVQLEHRMKLYRRIGLAAFGGISAITHHLKELKKENFKPNAGIGIRFLIDKTENTNLRFDYAFGLDNQSGFYISFGESF